MAVSYTHLDVYKRQVYILLSKSVTADKRALLHSNSDVSYDMSHRHFGIAADCIYTQGICFLPE